MRVKNHEVGDHFIDLVVNDYVSSIVYASKREIEQGLSIENTILEDQIAGWLKTK